MARSSATVVDSLLLTAVLVSGVSAQEPTRPVPRIVPQVPLRQLIDCVPTVSTQHVRAGVAGGDGSSARPFRTIAEALARAAAANACEVVVEIGRGIYAEPFELTRHTTLRGADREATVLRASIEQRGARRLVLERLSLRATSGPALVVANASAATVLREVTIDAAARHGIRQSGGTLELTDVDISQTGGGPTLYDGAAIYVDDGAQARLETVRTTGNRNGLVAEGGATKVTARRLEVSGGSSAFRTGEAYDREGDEGRGLAAVEIRGALLLAEDSRLSNNVGIGLLVAERGRLHARRVVIVGSRELPSTTPFRSWGGIDFVLNRSQAQLAGLTIGDARIGISAWESELKAVDLNLHDLVLGIALTSSDDPNRVSECLGLGEVRFDRVDDPVNFGTPSGALALPPSLGGDEDIRCLLNPEAPECQRRTGEFRPCTQVPWS